MNNKLNEVSSASKENDINLKKTKISSYFHTCDISEKEDNTEIKTCLISSPKFFVDSFSNSSQEKVYCKAEQPECHLEVVDYKWKCYTRENLNLKYAKIFSKRISDYILQRLEKEVEYFSGDLLKVRVFGKWHDIPRKQVSFGEPGLSYRFSGTCIPAVPWNDCEIVSELKQLVESVTGYQFNFVLINRYKDGEDHMGEHRDDEKDLVSNAPIASLSFGQVRDFIFRHKDSRSKSSNSFIEPLKLELEHGSLLLMEWPTNRFWYHSLPKRKKANNVRINLTFRTMVLKK